MHPRKYFTLNFFINEIFSVKKFPSYGTLKMQFMIMNAMGIDNNINLNSAHHSWKPVKHIIDHCYIEIIYDHTEFVMWILSFITQKLSCEYHLSSYKYCLSSHCYCLSSYQYCQILVIAQCDLQGHSTKVQFSVNVSLTTGAIKYSMIHGSRRTQGQIERNLRQSVCEALQSF